MSKNYSLYSVYLNAISVVIAIICVVFSILEKRFYVASIVLLIMTLVELTVNLINYRKFRAKIIDKKNKI